MFSSNSHMRTAPRSNFLMNFLVGSTFSQGLFSLINPLTRDVENEDLT
jgi:hypothetical protein